MNKREQVELAEATKKVVARWKRMSASDRALRLKAAGILDASGKLAERYAPATTAGEVKAGPSAR